MWCDRFDADLLKVVPGAAEALGPAGDTSLLTYCHQLTDGKINHPAVWHGAGALFWTALRFQPDAVWATSAPVVECTFLEAIRDEWVHTCSINVNGCVVWEPMWKQFEALMYDVRRWKVLDSAERVTIQQEVRESLAEAARRLAAVTQ